MKIKNNKKNIVLRDLNAKEMWLRKKNIVFKDKTKYCRKTKHKKNFLDE